MYIYIIGYPTLSKPPCDTLTWHSEPHLHWFAARSYCQNKGEDLVDDVNLSLCMDPSMSGEFWVGLFRISWVNEGKLSQMIILLSLSVLYLFITDLNCYHSLLFNNLH